jgi:hypothetical protein
MTSEANIWYVGVGEVERCMLLDATTKDELDDIQQSHLYGCVNANVILTEVDSLPLPLPVVLPFDNGSTKSEFFEDPVTAIQQQFSIYPNPSDGIFNLESENSGTITVFDFNGKLIQQFKIVAGMNKLNLEFLEQGVYLYVFDNHLGKMIIE